MSDRAQLLAIYDKLFNISGAEVLRRIFFFVRVEWVDCNISL